MRQIFPSYKCLKKSLLCMEILLITLIHEDDNNRTFHSNFVKDF